MEGIRKINNKLYGRVIGSDDKIIENKKISIQVLENKTPKYGVAKKNYETKNKLNSLFSVEN